MLIDPVITKFNKLDLVYVWMYDRLWSGIMPIYEYCCQKCDEKFDLLRSFSQADEVANCPKCNKEAKRLISTFASFSKDSSGISAPISGGGSSCAGCSASSCATCN